MDLAARVYVAWERRRCVSRHLLDLMIVVLPILRALRLLRSVILFRVSNRSAAKSTQGQVAA